MRVTGGYRNVLTFLSLYLLFAVPPFAALNWHLVLAVYEEYVPPDPLGIAILALGASWLFVGCLLADRGIDRYIQFIFWPNDLPSILVDGGFLWAAISWWAIPEIAAEADLYLTVDTYVLLTFISQLPLVLLLALFTVLGEAKRREGRW